MVLLCMVWLSLLPVMGQQQPAGYWLQHFTDENGLPQNSVKAIAQDGNGFIWLTTEAGLVRFDGHRFLTFEKSVIPITNNRIRGFVPAVGQDQGNSHYQFYALSEKNECIGILGNGLVRVDTNFYSKYKKYNPFAGNEFRYNSILASLPAQYPVDPSREHYFTPSDNGTYYLWHKKGITCYQRGKRSFTSEGPFRQFFLIGSLPYAVDASGKFTTVGEKKRDVIIEGDILTNSQFPKKGIPELFWNNVSRQAFLYLNKCFYSLKPSPSGHLTTSLLLKDFDLDDLRIITALFDENSGVLFLGSTTKGLLVFKKNDFHTQRLNEDNADNVYYAQVAGPGRSVLTSQGYLFSSVAGETHISASRVSPFMEKFGYKFALVQNQDKTLWMGIGFDLYKLDQTGRRVLEHVRMPEKAKSFFLDPEGKLWVGCDSDAIYTIVRSGASYIPRRMFRLGVSGIWIMGREDPETMLVGTEDRLFRLNMHTGTSQAVKPFENIGVRSFYTTRDGSWITTYGNGIYLLKKDKVVKFPLDHDRILATAHCIVEDKKGFFWISTNRGLFQVAKKQLLDYASGKSEQVYYLYYDKRDGFETNEFNGGCQPCALTLPDGTVSLPSMDGLVWYKPEAISAALPVHNIFVSAVQEDTKELEVKDTLEISRDFEQLRLSVTTPYLGNQKNIRMYYSLAGEGRTVNWLPVNQDYIITVPRIPHGDYTLKIRNVAGFGTNDYTYKTVHLHIPRAWYETWWFRALVVMAGAGLFLMSVRWRSAHLVRKEREASLIRHYRVISQIIAAVNHDIQTPLHYIGFSLRQFNAFVHKQTGVDPLIVRMSDETLDTSQRLNTLTKNILNYIKLQSKSPAERRDMHGVHVDELVRSVTELFSGIAAHREVRIEKVIDPALTVYTDPNLLSIIIHNLIDNALKVSQSQIRITAGMDGGRTQITIEDDGGGIPQDQLSWLNKNYRSYEDWMHASQNPGQKGVGLVIVKDLCVLLGIEIIVQVPGEKNTVIQLVLG